MLLTKTKINSTHNQSSFRVPLKTLVWYFFKTGWTAFGFTILQKLRSDLTRKGWATKDEIEAGISLVQLYPGPTNFDFVVYCGNLLHGVAGAVLAVLAFITPSFWLMVLLSWMYFSLGDLPWMPSLFLGLSAVVVGVLVSLILDLAERALKSLLPILILIASVIFLILGIHPVFIVLSGFLIGAFFLHQHASINDQADAPLQKERYVWWKIGAFFLPLVGVILCAIFLPGTISSMVLNFLKIGSIAFGNGAVIIPLLKTDVVDVFHWLTPQQFTDGVALGQVTPGPFLITSAFIGFKLGGILGALLGCFSIFYPTFLMTLIAINLFSLLQRSRFLHGGLRGVLPVFVGMLAVVTFQIGRTSLLSLPAVLLALTAFLFNRYLKVDVVWLFGGGMLIWIALMLLGLV